ncbi:phage tail terminator-like protein [Methylobacterium sp. Leaf108]|uniref:phage tail terminator-like protein n=1 Tax=Methylobacterium sp. Leaf108 TaxID=1736256 RepID=UPI001FCCF7D2|nr:phage tail terminator-like protein [Methylobacterium sp. Leaf108]
MITAVAARLANNWTRCPVRGPNEADGRTPAAGTAFLVHQYPISISNQISIGSPGANVYREEGAIRLVLNVGRSKGAATASLWADELAALFRGRVFDGVRTYAPSSPAIDDRNDEGPYFTLSVTVPYEHDTLG